MLPRWPSDCSLRGVMGSIDSSLDLAYLRGLFPDDEDAVREILTRFVDPAGGYVTDIHDAVAAGDAAQVGAIGHKLKSAARAVGAATLADLSEALERAGKRRIVGRNQGRRRRTGRCHA